MVRPVLIAPRSTQVLVQLLSSGLLVLHSFLIITQVPAKLFVYAALWRVALEWTYLQAPRGAKRQAVVTEAQSWRLNLRHFERLGKVPRATLII